MLKAHWFPITLFLIVMTATSVESIRSFQNQKLADKSFAEYLKTELADTVWRGENQYQIPDYNESGKLIRYGRELIANTSFYLGPDGTISRISNGMNCQNCHMDAGTVPYGNNFGKVYATYPQFRARNNGMQGIYDRINDCLQRSLNGKAMDSSAHEMRAMYAYFKWLGEDVPAGDVRGGTGIIRLKYMDRAADPADGQEIYVRNCRSCHGNDGQGQQNAEKTGYKYPPLWGVHSYNDGAGLYRLSSFAGFVKDNMPYGTDYHNPRLTDEEAWDVAAYVNSRPRPHLDQSGDWKNIAKKPVDFPYGPYADDFSEEQHKYGPFEPIRDAREKISHR